MADKKNKTVNEVFESILDEQKRWIEEKRIGTVSYDEKCDCITFHFDSVSANYRYWIGLSRLKDAKTVLQQINHLRQKRWFTKEVMDDLFDVLERLAIMPTGLDA